MRRVLKWSGTICCLFLIGFWILSAWLHIYIGGRFYTIDIHSGNFDITWNPQGFIGSGDKPDWRTYWSASPQSVWVARPRIFQFTVDAFNSNRYSLYSHGQKWWIIDIPLWMFALLAALPTVFFWWRDRRRIPPGHCRQCGYNLTGNVSGRCPECGTPASSADGV